MTLSRTCRGCGCTDRRACVTDDGPCSWVLVDLGSASGFCSACAEACGWHVGAMADVGFDEPDPRGFFQQLAAYRDAAKAA